MKDYTPFKENGKVEAAAPEPYPPLEVEGPNPQYARLLGIDMAGGRGEMTSITQYLYHSWTLPDFDNAAPTLRQIAQVEMHHLDIFATLAHQMGLDPRLWCTRNRTKCYWTPAYNSYPRRVREVVEHSIRGEEAAIKKYSRQADEICDEDIVKILERILLDERRHIEIFHAMLALLA